MKQISETDENTLIAACRERKPWAQRAIYDQFAPLMMSVCLRYVPEKETAKDLLQEGFIKVFTKIDTYSGSGVFAGWVRRIFVTTALEYLRQKNVLKESNNIDDIGHIALYDEQTIVEQLSREELLNCINRLPDGFRTVFNLYVIEGYSHSEIAEMLGISEVTSRTQFMRARKVLQKEIDLLYKTTDVGQKQTY